MQRRSCRMSSTSADGASTRLLLPSYRVPFSKAKLTTRYPHCKILIVHARHKAALSIITPTLSVS